MSKPRGRMPEASPRIMVLGGGITGLAAAYEIAKIEPNWEVILLEASPRLGGKVVTEKSDGFIWEDGPDSMATNKPQALELARELGLSEELIGADVPKTPVLVYSSGKLHPLPGGMSLLSSPGILPFLGSGLLSFKAKLRLALALFVDSARESAEDESLGGFIRRRFDGEILDKIFEPLLAGLHAASADELSLDASFPQLRRLRWKIRAVSERESKTALFMTLRGGLASLTDALARRLAPGSARAREAAVGLKREPGSWRVSTTRGGFEADAVIAAVPAWAFADIAWDCDRDLASILREIHFASSAVVSLVYEAAGFPARLNAMGVLIPRSENKAMFAASFVSTKFPHRALTGSVVIRCFLGGNGGFDVAAASESELARTAQLELSEILALGRVIPARARVRRWINAHPRYAPGHGRRVKDIEASLKKQPGLFVAGSSYHGIGLSDCVASARKAAAAARDFVKAGRGAVV